MGSLHVALYAEGARELAGLLSWRTAPGEVLLDDELGPVHHLVARTIDAVTTVPLGAARFVAPVNDRRGRQIRGSMLHGGPHLLQALTAHALIGVSPVDSRPGVDVFVVLVDRDGSTDRRNALEEALATAGVTGVVAVAIEELEAWLIADHAALATALGQNVDDPGPREELTPGAAKRFLLDRLQGKDESDVRSTLAQIIDLAVVRANCPSFDRFCSELQAAIAIE